MLQRRAVPPSKMQNAREQHGIALTEGFTTYDTDCASVEREATVTLEGPKATKDEDFGSR
jgi:hypothetical protein